MNDEWIGAIVELSKGMSRPVFRGQAKSHWEPDSAAVRRLKRAYGDNILEDQNKLREKVRQYQEDQLIVPMKVIGGDPKTDIQMLSVLQHHRAATMLLDFTENPLVALWFACCEKPNWNGRVFVADIGDPLYWTNGRKVRDPFDPEQGLVYYEPDWSLSTRIVSQRSVFLICNPRIPDRALKSFAIPKKAKASVRKKLVSLGLSTGALFGDVAGLAAQHGHKKPLRKIKETKPEDYKKRGNLAYQEKRYEAALASYRIYAEKVPDSADPHFLRGNALAGLGRHPEAIEAFTEAIHWKERPQPNANVVWEDAFIRETLSNIYYNRGNSHAALGKSEAAVRDFDNALEHDAKKPRDVLFNRANSKYALGQFESAREDYLSAGGNFRSDTALGIGNCELMLGRLKEALGSYLSGGSQEPKGAALHCKTNADLTRRILTEVEDKEYCLRVQGNDLLIKMGHAEHSFGFSGNSGNIGNRRGGDGYSGASGFRVRIVPSSASTQ